MKMRIGVDECIGYRSFLFVDDLVRFINQEIVCFSLIKWLNQIWAGSKDGRLMLFCTKNYDCEKSFKAHNDTVRSLCYVENNK